MCGLVVVMVLVAGGTAFADSPGTTVTVTPSTNLNPAGQNVSVSGTGFGVGGTGAILQCIVRDEFTEDCSDNIGTFTATASGAFGPVVVTVSRNFTAGGSPATCSVATPCSIWAVKNFTPQNAHAPITFITASSEHCSLLHSRRSLFNARIDQAQAALGPSEFSRLEALRAIGNAQIDKALAYCSASSS